MEEPVDARRRGAWLMRLCAAPAALWLACAACDQSPATPVEPASAAGEPAAATGVAPDPRSVELARVRQSCRLADLDQFVEEQRALVEADPSPAPRRVLAEALYERVLARDLALGLRVGALVDPGRYAQSRVDVEEALSLLAALREAGSVHPDVPRLEAGLLSCQLTDMMIALKLRGRIGELLAEARRLDPHNGHLHVALGCQQLFVPAWLGQDLVAAETHFRHAEAALPHNERPMVFAAFAAHLAGRLDDCRDWLRRARERNRDNPFVRAVLRRISAGEAEPFARDLTDAEIRG